MPDQETVIAEQAERIAILEEQTRELQEQMNRLQGSAGRRKRPKRGARQILSGSRELLERTFVVLVFFASIPFILLGFTTPLLEVVPGGSSIWVPVWWAAVFLMCGIGVFLFVTSND